MCRSSLGQNRGKIMCFIQIDTIIEARTMHIDPAEAIPEVKTCIPSKWDYTEGKNMYVNPTGAITEVEPSI